jgi:hypothetical protein
LAARFEPVASITWSTTPRNGATNTRRRRALARAIEGDYVIPLETMIQLHAGDLVDRPIELREGFYGQAWALAEMLSQPPHRAGLERLLTDAARGTGTFDLGPADGSGRYDPARVKPLLEKYVAPDWAAFAKAYDRFIRQMAGRSDE